MKADESYQFLSEANQICLNMAKASISRTVISIRRLCSLLWLAGQKAWADSWPIILEYHISTQQRKAADVLLSIAIIQVIPR